MMAVLMKTSPACDHCGTPLIGDLCPRCLLNVGMSSEPEKEPVLPDNAPSLGRLGDYELLEEIGRGGMGIVYRARQMSLDRIVAVKLLPFGGLGGSDVALRLRAEAVAAGNLRHPNIVAIHEVGLHQGQHFLALDFVAGPSLAHVLRDGPLPAKRAATLLRQVALAVQHAHERGIIHRDLKPSNILLDATDDEPRVTDFGLAKNLRSDTQLTLTGQTLGSPNYIPPEQIRGFTKEPAIPTHPSDIAGEPTTSVSESPRSGERLPRSAESKVSFASDVYALGATLYHALTGRPPFIGDEIHAVLDQVLNSEPLRLRQLNPSIPPDLETICLKCLEKEPTKRYATARELSDELGRFLNNEPIHAVPTSNLGRAWRWCRRKPALAGSLFVILILLLIVSLGSPIAVFRIKRERNLAQFAASKEIQLRRHAEAQAYTSDMNAAQQAWDEGDMRRARMLLEKYIPRDRESDLRGFEWRYQWNHFRDESRFTFTNFQGDVAIRRSPDGHFVAARSGRTIRLLDIELQREIGSLLDDADMNSVHALAFARNATNLLATTSGRAIKLWDLSTRRIVVRLEQPDNGSRAALDFVALSPDGMLLAAGDRAQAISLWDLGTQTIRWSAKTELGIQPGVITFTPDGRKLISGGGKGGNPVFWDVVTGEPSPLPMRHQGWIYCAEFSPDGRWLATGGHDNTVIVWDVRTLDVVARFIGHRGFVSSATFSPDSQYLATGGVDSTVRLWHVPTQRQVALYRGHRDAVSSVAFSRDGQLLISASWDRTVKVWNVSPTSNRDTLQAHAGWTNWIQCVAFSPDGRRLAATDFHEGFVRLWDVDSRTQLIDLGGWAGYSSSVTFSPDGTLLAANGGGAVHLWDAKDLTLRGVITNEFGHGAPCFSPNSQILALVVGGFDVGRMTNRLAFWNVRTRQPILKLAAAAAEAHTVAFSNDGRLVAVGHFDGTVRLWDYQTEKLLAEFNEYRDYHNYIWTLAFDRSGKLLIAGDEMGRLRFYDLLARKPLQPRKEHVARVWCVVFAPDGRSFASCSDDGTIKLWNVATYQSALTLRSSFGPVAGIAFSRDGGLMASCGANGTVRLWPAASEDEVPKGAPTEVDAETK